MSRVKRRIARELPALTAYFQSGGLVDAVLNMGMPAPIDVQVGGTQMHKAYDTALQLVKQIKQVDGVADVFIRRIWIIPDCNWTSIAFAPRNWG